jgi:hypothetical protein
VVSSAGTAGRGEATGFNTGPRAHWLRHNERQFVSVWKDNDGQLHPDICLCDKDGLINVHSGSRSNIDKHFATRHPRREYDQGEKMMMRGAFGIAAADAQILDSCRRSQSMAFASDNLLTVI